jgi:hypothetical protein
MRPVMYKNDNAIFNLVLSYAIDLLKYYSVQIVYEKEVFLCHN